MSHESDILQCQEKISVTDPSLSPAIQRLHTDPSVSPSIQRLPFDSQASATQRSTRNAYCTRPLDPSLPPISVSHLMCIPHRQGRKFWENPSDTHLSTSYGDPVIQKSPSSTRIFFQNVKGLSTSSGREDYRYYLDCLQALQVDVSGLAETNTCWQHQHLRDDFKSITRKHYRQSKVVFGSPTFACDPIPSNESFQAGGNITMLNGGLVSRVSGADIQDTSGLGRWSGVTLAGKHNQYLSIITAYRVCSGSIRTASLGSAFAREHQHFATASQPTVNPRKLFLRDLQQVIQDLQEKGHSILLMLDANATDSSDSHFSDFIASCSLNDLHSDDPAPSTYIGSATRRIDVMFGCHTVYQHLRRSGTLSYHEGPQSDHRSLFVDLDLAFLQVSDDCIAPNITRALHTGNPELVKAYNASLLQYYTTHRMVERITELYEQYHQMSREDIRAALIKWDNDQGRAMALGEKRLYTPPKKCKWSPILRNLAKTRLYWKLRLREVEKNANYSSTFHRWQSQIQEHDPTFAFPHSHEQLSAERIRSEFNKASEAFRRCQKAAIPLRMKCYEALLDKYSDDFNPETSDESRRKAKIVRNTIDGEVLRSKFRDIRRVMKPTSSTSLSKVMLPRKDEHGGPPASDATYQFLQETDPQDLIWETVVERDQIERHLLDYNQASFRAASESPCGHGLIHDALKFSSISPASINLLSGEIPQEWHQDDECLREFLASFIVPESVHKAGDIPTEITDDDVLYCFKNWRETTSTSPSGRHLGHYRSLIQNPILLNCFVKFMNIAVQSGISIPRWSNAVNVMIEKDSGKPKINRLRIIHLFEADLNFFLKLQWGHRLVRRAMDLNLLHDGQHGSIPRRSAINPIMLTQLTTDLCRILKHDYARFDNDASACYDRIIIALAMLAARKCGMPIHAIRTHADALFFMRYAVKTIYGISEETYQGTVFEPLFGTGQGSGASPSAWLTLVVILLQTLDRLVPDRINFSSPKGDLHHSRLADAFVDDTYLGFTSSSNTATFESLVTRLQDIAQKWEHLLFLSGGKLNLAKCSWYIMRWEWDKGRPSLRPILPTDPTVTLRQGNAEGSSTIRRTKIEDSQRMLGFFLNPLGDFGDHVKYLKSKADTFAQRLMSPRLTSSDVRIFHRTTYIPSMRYGLAAVAIDEEVLGTVQSKVVKSILQKLHVQSTIPTAIRHGPAEFGGLDIYDLRTEAGLEAIKFFRDSVYTDSENGKLLRMNLHYSQIEAGIGHSLLEHPGIHLSYLTPTWLLSIRQFLYCHNMTITMTDNPTIPLQGPQDQYIMQPQHLDRYSATQQRDLNLVRLYLQVHTLADMSNLSRRQTIDLCYLDARRPHDFVNNSSWPRQATPTKSQARLWKRFIRSSYLRYVPYWTADPRVGMPTSVQDDPRLLDVAADFPNHLARLPQQHRRLLDGFQQLATDLQVWKAFRSRRRLHFATDGGLHAQKGTHGWVISTGTKILFQCAGPVDGPRDTASSTRSELGGYASALLLIRALYRFWGLRHRSKFHWYCDSKAAISRVKRYTSHKTLVPKMPDDADLMSIIRSCQQELHTRIRIHWVKGHQDTTAKQSTLSLASRLNILADALATNYRQSGSLKSIKSVAHEPEQRLSIAVNGIRLTSQYDASIRFHINGYHLRNYLQAKKGWTNKVWESVDFYTFGKHFRRLQPHQQSTWMKFVHNQLPLGERRYLQAPVKADTLRSCPCCKEKDETLSHFSQCPSNPAFSSSLRTLRADISTTDLHPVRSLIYAGLHHYFSGSTEAFQPSINSYPLFLRDSLRLALASQAEIGWQHAAQGFLSTSWRDIACRPVFQPGTYDEKKGIACMSSIVKGIYDHNIRLWKSRNAALHSTDEVDLETIRSAEAVEIINLHSNPDLLRFSDRYLCSRPLDKLLASAPATRRRWLRRVKASKEMHIHDGTRQALITSFLTTTA